jgi:hypothetical protein
MRRVLAAVAFASLSIALVACSYIFELPSLDFTLDAGIATEGGLGDGGPVGDGGPPPIFKPPPPPFCSSLTTPKVFCADFDDASPPTVDSVGTPQSQAGQLIVVDSVSLSPTRSLLLSASGAGSRALVVRSGVGATAGVTFSMDALVSKWLTTSAEIASVTLTGAGATCGVHLIGSGGSGGGWSVVQSCATDAGPQTVTSDAAHPIDPGSWHRFAVSVALGAPKKVTLDIDGVLTVDVGALDTFEPGQAAVSFGLDAMADGSAVVFLDDLLITSP